MFPSVCSSDKENRRVARWLQKLEHSCGLKLDVKINDNRSTVLRVKWEKNYAKVSLHRMFLQAPCNVMEDLACYLSRQHQQLTPSVKAYIESHVQKLDYSQTLDLSSLKTRGKVYDLAALYCLLNKQYFNNALQLHITWYGEKWKRGKTRITFGSYNDPLRLIKIHRLLDDETVPEYVVAYVMYHEMLHHVCPPYVDVNGCTHIHTEEFLNRERLFRGYKKAKFWIEDHQTELFGEKF